MRKSLCPRCRRPFIRLRATQFMCQACINSIADQVRKSNEEKKGKKK